MKYVDNIPSVKQSSNFFAKNGRDPNPDMSDNKRRTLSELFGKDRKKQIKTLLMFSCKLVCNVSFLFLIVGAGTRIWDLFSLLNFKILSLLVMWVIADIIFTNDGLLYGTMPIFCLNFRHLK